MMMNLRTGRVAQHAVTGERFEIRKFFPESGLVLIKIRRGDHYNTYKIRRELVWHVGDPLQAKELKARAAAKCPKLAELPRIEQVTPHQVAARLGAGVDRKGFDLDANTVLKMALHENGKKANRAEVTLWNERQDMRPFLCPIVSWADDFSWLIMAKATEFNRHTERELPAQVRAVVTDLHSGNIGVVAGRVVVTDYGYNNVAKNRYDGHC